MKLDPRVEPLDLRRRSYCTLARGSVLKDPLEARIAYVHSNMLFRYEKLRAEIVLSHQVVIADCE